MYKRQLIERPFKPLVPTLRFDLASRVNLRSRAAGLDAHIDRSLTLFRYFGLLAEENHVKSLSFHTAVNGL